MSSDATSEDLGIQDAVADDDEAMVSVSPLHPACPQ
jgi:hypothetical protein